MISTFLSRSALLLAMLLPAAQAADVPAKFNFCSIDVPFPPYAKVDGSGHIQHLIAQTAQKLNLNFDRHVAPRRRCLEEIKTGVADGMIGAFSPEWAEYAAFPMANGAPDESRALTVVRFSIYRRIGTNVDWDGQRFIGLGNGAIGVETAFVYIADKLKQAGVNYDDGGKTLAQNLEKLVKGRIDGVVAMEVAADRMIAERYAGKIEQVAKPFDQTILFLMVSKPFQARYPKFMESYWQAIKDYRGTAEYRQYQQRNP